MVVIDNKPVMEFTIYNNDGIKRRYEYDERTQRYKSKGTIQSLLEMHTLMYKSLKLVSPNLIFTPDFPDNLLDRDDPKYNKDTENINFDEYIAMPHHRNDLFEHNYDKYKTNGDVMTPHVTWGVVRTQPGAYGGPPFAGTKELKPRLREVSIIYKDDSKDDIHKHVKIYGQAFDNLVQYNIWTRTNWEAEELTEWFHKQYLLEYTPMFEEAGIINMTFNRRVRDDTLVQIKNNYHLRSFLYYIRTESISVDYIEPIRQINTKVYLSNNIGNINDEEINNMDDILLKKWHQTNLNK